MERREVMQQQEMSFVARGKRVTNCSVTIHNYVSLSLKHPRTCRGEDTETENVNVQSIIGGALRERCR